MTSLKSSFWENWAIISCFIHSFSKLFFHSKINAWNTIFLILRFFKIKILIRRSKSIYVDWYWLRNMEATDVALNLLYSRFNQSSSIFINFWKSSKNVKKRHGRQKMASDVNWFQLSSIDVNFGLTCPWLYVNTRFYCNLNGYLPAYLLF